MKKFILLVLCAAASVFFFSCQTNKAVEPSENANVNTEQIQDPENTQETQIDSGKGTENIVHNDISSEPQSTIAEVNPQQEFVPLYSQDVEAKENQSDEFIPVEEPLVIDLTAKKDENLNRTVKPSLRPRTSAETSSAAKIWNPDENGSALPQSTEIPNEQTVIEEAVQTVKPESEPSPSSSVVKEVPEVTASSTDAAASSKELISNEKTAEKPASSGAESSVMSPLSAQVKQESALSETGNGSEVNTGAKNTSPEVTEKKPSRSVEVKNNQYIDVSYPGNGWVYIGEEGGSSNVTYFGRKTENGNTVFTLRSKKSGTALLHFYKTDPLSGIYIDDYLELTISTDSSAQMERFQVPLYEMNSALTAPVSGMQTDESTPKSTIPKKDPEWASSVSAEPDVEILLTDEAPSDILSSADPDVLMSSAKEAVQKNDYINALRLLDEFLSVSTDKLDEAWFIKGQIYETPSIQRNIRKALESYETLVKAYPGSAFWKQAKERITYLEKFYFTIQ